MNVKAQKSREPWQERLTLPSYQVQEAAKYTGIAPQTVAHWQSKIDGFLPSRNKGESLSYLQLIEVAVVAAFRNAGITLSTIRETREYIQNLLKSEYPFADYQFKANGKRLVIDYAHVDKKRGKGKLLETNRNGQLAWAEVLQNRLKEFEYDKVMVLRWHVAGAASKIIIDPRISFGAPAIKGTPTWAIKGRWTAGEKLPEIAEDFGLTEKLVVEALKFEGLDVGHRENWPN